MVWVFQPIFDLITDGVSSKAVPLLFFAMGIEVSQLFIVFVAVLLSSLLQTLFKITRRDWILVVSAIGIGLAIPMIASNAFW